MSEVSLASCGILISCTKLNTALKAALLTFTEATKRFFNRIDLSVAKKIALEDTWLHCRIRALDLRRVSVHCPPAFPYKPKWLTNVIYNSPIKIRNKTLSLRWWDKEDSTAECSTEEQFTRLVLTSEREFKWHGRVCLKLNWNDQFVFHIMFDQMLASQS